MTIQSGIRRFVLGERRVVFIQPASHILIRERGLGCVSLRANPWLQFIKITREGIRIGCGDHATYQADLPQIDNTCVGLNVGTVLRPSFCEIQHGSD